MKRDRRAAWILAALLVVTFALRLVYLSHALDISRFYDERYGLKNVAAVLGEEGRLSAFYPSLSFAPQAALLGVSDRLHRWTGREVFSIHDPNAADGWSKTAYFLCRILSALFGTISIWLLARLGSRMFDPATGLLAALLWSAGPRHLLSSSHFKPDILVALLTLVAFGWARRAAHQPSARRFAQAGAGLGLAVAAKYTGVGIVFSILAAAGVGARGSRRLRWLSLAGLTSLAAFFLLNPHIGTILRFLPRLWNIAESKGAAENGSHFGVVVSPTRFLLRQHGGPLFVLVAVGLGLWLFRLASSSTPRRRRIDLALILAYVVGYSALWIVGTTVFRGQNHLPVVAFTSLAAAAALVDLGRALAVRWPAIATPRRLAIVGALLGIATLTLPVGFVYQGLVPSTFDRAEGLLLRKLPHPQLRQVWLEEGDHVWRLFRGGERMVRIKTSSLALLEPSRLAKADAAVFLASRLEEENGDAYRALLDLSPEVRRIPPRLFRSHGPELVLLFGGWKLVGDCQPLALEGGPSTFLAPRLSSGPNEELPASISAWLPTLPPRRRPRRLVVAGEKMPLRNTRKRGRRSHFLTPRTSLDLSDPIEIAFEPSPAVWKQAPLLEICRWRRVDPR